MNIPNLIGGFLALSLLQCWSVQPFEVSIETSIEDRWRWTEQEELSGLNFLCATEGVNGDIWFARKEGVARYDGRSLDYFDFADFEAGTPTDIHASSDGVIYLLSNTCLAILKNGQWRILKEYFNDISLIRESINEAKNGDIWVGIGSNLLRYRDEELSVFEAGLRSVSSTLIDLNGLIWVADEKTGNIAVFEPKELDNGALPIAYRFDGTGSNELITKLFMDSGGRVWVIDLDVSDRCYLYDNYQKRLAAEGLRTAELWKDQLSIAEQPEGRYWFSISRKLGELVSGKIKTYEVEEYALPTSYAYILGLSGERLLIGGRHSKTYIIDLSMDRWMSYPDLNFQGESTDGTHWFLDHSGRVISNHPDKEDWLIYDPSDGIIDTPNRILNGQDGTVWLSGAHNGMAAVSYREDNTWRRQTFPDAGTILSHLSAIETTDGAVLFGSGTPPNELEGRSGGAVVFRKVEGIYRGAHLKPPLFPPRTANMVERKNDGLWYGAGTLMHRQGSWVLGPEKKELFQDYWIDHMIIDHNNDLWVAYSGTGIYQFNGEEWFLHDETKGLGSNQVIFLMNGKWQTGIWATTAEGLSRYDGRSWSNWSFSTDILFQRENNTMFESNDGSLWINYAYRSWLVEGKTHEDNRTLFQTVRYKADLAPPVSKFIGFIPEIPEGSQSTFSWKGVDLWSDTPAGELEYSWRLDKQPWTDFSNKTSITLDQLKSGLHQFEVRARDRDWNVEASPPFAEIRVIPPVWKRTWFILTIVAALIIFTVLISALIKIRIKTAIALEEFKLDFFTNISHELINPLSVIIAPLESILRKENSKETRTSLGIALRNARKMQGLVNQLLQFRKMELGMSAYNPSHGEISGFIKEAVEAHAPLWEAMQQTVTVHTEPDYFNCSYDADKLQKIVDNLLTNAIKYTGEGGEINVRLAVTLTEDHPEAHLVVEDNGNGIPEDEIDLVFKPFYRAKSKKKGQEGFGIGLALVGQLVQFWGGEHYLESPVSPSGKGTRVTIRLPLDTVNGESTEEESENLLLFEHENELSEKRLPRLLVVEDNEDLRFFMKEELSERYRILEAKDGKQGLDTAIKSNPDLVITDVMMPEMDGFELCQRMRSNPETSHIPVIILTAKSSEESSLQGIQSGADAYLTKPLNMLRLLAQIDNLLQQRKSLKDRFSKRLEIEPKELTVTSTDEAILRKAVEVVEAYMQDEAFDVNRLAKEMGMSRPTLNRKLKAFTGQTPNLFIRSMRMKRAAQLLRTGKVTVSETLSHVGIYDLSYFSRVFKKEFGLSPTKYVSKYKIG